MHHASYMMKSKSDNFHEELRTQLLQNPEFIEEYKNFSLKLQSADELKSVCTKSKIMPKGTIKNDD